MDFSFGELIVVGLIAFLVLGPQDLVRYAHLLGKYLGRFRTYANNFKVLAQEEFVDGRPLEKELSGDERS